MIALRPLMPHDLPWLCAMEQSLQAQPWSLAMLEEELRLDAWGRIACSPAQQPMGYAIARRFVDELHLLTLGTALPHQRQGVARHLLQALVDYAQAEQIPFLLLEVAASNRPACTLYQDMGFRLLYTRKSYYTLPGGHGEAFVMRRELMPDKPV
ncbi:MAG: GNAT family N-acetyltransferase [Magnetococcales bacterium]|nr:GNAT family N-acetyltransferase [Magnetococcales bacterium]